MRKMQSLFQSMYQLEQSHGEEIMLQFLDQPKLNQNKFLINSYIYFDNNFLVHHSFKL